LDLVLVGLLLIKYKVGKAMGKCGALIYVPAPVGFCGSEPFEWPTYVTT